MHDTTRRSGWRIFALAALAAAPAGAASGQTPAGDPTSGREIFAQQCAKCHTVGPGAATSNAGPLLNGVIGRRSGTYPDFNYSPQFRSARLVWDGATLARFLKAPKSTVPGTRMLFNGLPAEKDAFDVIAFLAQFDETGAPKK
jgi:cytochrome c